MDYERYEKIKQKLEDLEGLLEHITIYDMVQKRKAGPTKKTILRQTARTVWLIA